MRRQRVLAMILVGAAACTGGAPRANPSDAATPTFGVSGTPIVYAAVGASETAGVGTFDPLRNAWPRVLWKHLPTGSTFFDFGVPGSTAAEALREQVPETVRVAPDVVTVWLNVNDLIAGVSPRIYGRSLSAIVTALRRGGQTTVLVANAPRLERLPAYLACRSANGLYVSGSGAVVQCPSELLGHLPSPGVVRAAVDAYNARTAVIVRTAGAILVDLHGLGSVVSAHPEYIADDGFHPSNEGAVVVAKAFADALAASGTG